MDGGRSTKAVQYAVAIAFGVVGAVAIWYWGAPTPSTIARQASGSSSGAAASGGTEDSVVMAYIRAYQDGRCSEVIARTRWMQARLDLVRRTGGSEAIEEERRNLCRGIMNRSVEENQLTTEGIEDRYLFAPGTEISFVGADDGRENLEDAVRVRNWFRVEFPKRERAPRDKQGAAIASIVVGLNLGEDGYIVKAGVRGDAEIDWEKIEVYRE